MFELLIIGIALYIILGRRGVFGEHQRVEANEFWGDIKRILSMVGLCLVICILLWTFNLL